MTFAVGIAFLEGIKETSEGYMVLIMALMEIPALVTGVILAKRGAGGSTQWGKLLHEILTGTSIFLMVAGVIVGYYAGAVKLVSPLDKMFVDLFMGVLALFLLEMGLLASARLAVIRAKGPFLLGFGILFPLTAGAFGAFLGAAFGLSLGGTMMLAVLYASCSYIAAPAAMRIAVPEADPAVSIGASLGVTFPFNIFIGVPIYFQMAKFFKGMF